MQLKGPTIMQKVLNSHYKCQNIGGGEEMVSKCYFYIYLFDQILKTSTGGYLHTECYSPIGIHGRVKPMPFPSLVLGIIWIGLELVVSVSG